MIKNIAGVDIGKEFSYAYILSSNEYIKFNNDIKGISLFIERLKEFGVKNVVMEGTGGLHRLLVLHLQKQGLKAFVANPEAVWAYKKSVCKRAKTDRIDSKQIAEFGKLGNVFESRPLAEQDIELKELSSRREQFINVLEADKKRLKQYNSVAVKQDIEENIKYLEMKIKKIEALMLEGVQKNEAKKKVYEILKSVPCIGDVNACSLAIDVEELGFVSSKKISSLIGVAPFNNESGKFIGGSHIRGGRSQVRKKLYMAVFCGITHNPVIREFYKRLRNNGKNHRQAIVACIRKLIVIINKMVETGEKWDEKKAVHSTAN
jgi:transposase